ncbi:protein NLP4 isoform X3 [Cucumis melo var. makuwa]|uniref:Protein NLP4 isoform X3 n=1 Tax=Cucumis melo var. makuwa TaxID=1194695 RepID=A0A5D3D8Z7_CUCMM|nr:protein NLP4 isoform X3 [Cucumis melo var. makuwa]
MDDGMLSPATMLDAPAETAMDLDYMDGLFLDGCWLETADGTEFLHTSPSSFGVNLDPLIGWPATDMNGDFNMTQISRSNQEEGRKISTDEMSLGRKRIDMGQEECSDQSENNGFEGSEMCRRLWIGPGEHLGSPTSVMERLIRAVGYIKDFVRDKDVLVQVWVPINRGGRNVLITNDLPFSQNSSCTRLTKYRDVSVTYEFTADEDSKKALGLPGRVFSRKVPEWTPDVRFFRSDEYPRVNHAHEHDVRGTVALPIFEQGSKNCLGVIEVVMVTQQVKYGSELENVCKALEAVKLRSSDVIGHPNKKVFNRSNEAVLLEIQNTLKTACETHGLPLAQTWASCVQQSRGGCRHSDENYSCCVSTVDRACFVADQRIQEFHEACSEHHLLKGEGIVGMAFKSNEPCFSSDITSFCNTEYPLSHHAKLFGLHAAVAIRLRCIYISKTDFVLEFFLPVNCRDPEEQRVLLTSLSTIIQRSCRSLRLVTDKECREENMQQSCRSLHLVTDVKLGEESQFPFGEAGLGANGRSAMQDMSKGGKPSEVLSSSGYQHRGFNYDLNGVVEDSEECTTVGNGTLPDVGLGKTGEKRRTKVDKTITLQVLRQYFAGSLKDAAKSIGVCPTTLKRICRQHGIKRWPSRKIKKVGHSLQKLQLVIDSVEGASGAFQIGSLYSNFQELASPNLSGSGSGPPFGAKMGDCLKTSNEVGMSNLQRAASKSPSSSCSQSSSSSQCFSSRSHQNIPHWNEAGSEDQMGGVNPCDGELKRVKSEVEIHVSIMEGSNVPRRSQSCKSLCKHPGAECVVHTAKESNGMAEAVEVQRVKVSFGEEKIRFRVHNRWRHEELLNEIAKRFSISDISKFDLKYLDDESEWVLLTSDTDLQECFHVYKSSRVQTIKLSLQVSRRHKRNFLASSGFS